MGSGTSKKKSHGQAQDDGFSEVPADKRHKEKNARRRGKEAAGGEGRAQAAGYAVSSSVSEDLILLEGQKVTAKLSIGGEAVALSGPMARTELLYSCAGAFGVAQDDIVSISRGASGAKIDVQNLEGWKGRLNNGELLVVTCKAVQGEEVSAVLDPEQWKEKLQKSKQKSRIVQPGS